MAEESLEDQKTAEAEDSATSDDSAASGDRKRPVGLAIAVVLALVVGVGAGWVVGDRSSDDDTAADDEAEGHEDGHAIDATAAAGEDEALAQLLADHHYEAPPEEPLDSEERQLLTFQLTAVNELIEQYPTVADAEADDWRRAGPFIPGLGTHYIPRDTDYTITIPDSVDGDEGEDVRPLLIFEGLDGDAPLAGFMFMAVGGEPEGFVGPYDRWHQHENICVVQTGDAIELPFVADLDDVTEEMCTDRGGTVTEISSHMVHIWSVPGYDSELGLFSEVNPRITCPDGSYDRHPYDQLESDETACLT